MVSPSIRTPTPNPQTQASIRPSITRFNGRFSRRRYQHTARVILPGLKRVCWIHLYLESPRKSRSQGGLAVQWWSNWVGRPSKRGFVARIGLSASTIRQLSTSYGGLFICIPSVAILAPRHAPSSRWEGLAGGKSLDLQSRALSPPLLRHAQV